MNRQVLETLVRVGLRLFHITFAFSALVLLTPFLLIASAFAVLFSPKVYRLSDTTEEEQKESVQMEREPVEQQNNIELSGIFMSPQNVYTIHKDRSLLTIHGSYHIPMTKQWPNVWWRFWQWVFFGFVWKELK